MAGRVVTMVTHVSPSVIFWRSSAMMSRVGFPWGYPLTDFSMESQSGPPMTMREPKRSCIILAPPITYLTAAGSRPSFFKPPTISSSELYVYKVSISGRVIFLDSPHDSFEVAGGFGRPADPHQDCDSRPIRAPTSSCSTYSPRSSEANPVWTPSAKRLRGLGRPFQTGFAMYLAASADTFSARVPSAASAVAARSQRVDRPFASSGVPR